MDLVSEIGKKFWSTDVWLPSNVTWEDIAPGSREDVNHADYRDLIWPFPLAIIVMLIRYALESWIIFLCLQYVCRLVFKIPPGLVSEDTDTYPQFHLHVLHIKFWIAPIGKSFGIKSSRPKKASSNPVLEAAYEKSSRLGHKTVLTLTKQTDLTERQIQRWWRLRRAQDKPSTLVKFCENSWRCIYYAYSFIYGVIVLWDKSWLWDVRNCWYGYPHQSVDNGIWWYYMISMSFYWSLTGTQFFDVKRKDFWQMFIHHMVTLLLMALSWVCNLHRVGSLVLVVHDCADIFLEAAKLTKYANFQKTCDVIFGIFTVIWIITRLVLLPRIIYSSSIEAPQILPMFPAYYIFNGLLIMLLVLHIFWTYMILKIVVDSVKKGLMSGDIRSSDSEDISDSSESTKLLTNGTPKDKTANSASLPNSNIGDDPTN